MTTDAVEPAAPADPAPSSAGASAAIVLDRCERCSTRVRRDEMRIHLAHAHNIGPAPQKKEKRKGSGGRPAS